MPPVIEANKVVRIAYTLRNQGGDVLDSSEGGPPLAYIHGRQQIVPGLEKAISGLGVGEKKSVVVSPDEGYGQRQAEAIMRLPREFFPPDAVVSVGDIFEGEDDEGGVLPVRVTKIASDHIEVDANHPLAGETLYYEIEIVEVRDPTPQELASGMVPDGN